MPRRKERNRNALRDYQEWVANRYNPGHWTGGRVSPDVKSVWSTKDRKLVGWVFVASSVLDMGYSLRQVTRDSADEVLVLASLVAIPFFIIGVMMILNLPRPSSKAQSTQAEDEGDR
jgi:hypothetical protein